MLGHDTSGVTETTATIRGSEYRSSSSFGYQVEYYLGTAGSDVQWNHTTILPGDYALGDDADAGAICEASSNALDRWAKDNPY